MAIFAPVMAFLRNLLASVLGFFIALFLIGLLVVGIGSAAVAFNSNKVAIPANSVIKLQLDDEILEMPHHSKFEAFAALDDDFEQKLSIKQITDNIRRAGGDDKVKGIMLETELVNTGLANLLAIRNALLDFKKSGKFIYSYSEIYTQRNYFLASVADSVFIHPEGVFSFSGFHSEQVFLKGLFEKLDIEPMLFRAGRYKSAGEMFTKKELSDANREQITSYVNSIYGFYLEQIAPSRNVSSSELRDIADNLKIKYPQDAVTYKLADAVVYRDQYESAVRQRLGIEEKKKIQQISMGSYARDRKIKFIKDKRTVAIIYAAGDIAGGDGSPRQIGSDKLSEEIKKARLDEDVKAIVLRVNSPGGGSLASDVIWREVMLAKAVKPVVVSMGDVAASGGYLIAAPADTIVAEPTTITGSIGVFALLPYLQEFWNNKLGISFDRVSTGKYSDIGNPNRKMTPEEKQLIQNMVDTVYSSFKNKVVEGRALSPAAVDSLAQGRVYSGIQAKSLGLVDVLGSFDDAISIAAQMAGLEQGEYRITERPRYDGGLGELVGAFTRMSSPKLSPELQEYYELVTKATDIANRSGILMLYPYQIEVN